MKHFVLDTLNFYETYFIDDNKRPTIVIVPGGGYHHASPRESLPIAKFYNEHGYHAIVINYRENLNEFYPIPQTIVAYTISQIRLDERVDKVIGIGFSAGGHNLLECALHSNKYGYDSHLDLLMLAYPVVTADENYWHKGSFEYLLGSRFNDLELRRSLSLETQVTEDAPDLFLWGTTTDESVPVMNSLYLFEAYIKNKRNVEYHSFPMGYHGMSLAIEETCGGNEEKINPYIARWAYLSLEWLKLKLGNKE